MDNDLNLISSLFLKALHNPSSISQIIQIAANNQINTFKSGKITEIIIQSIYNTQPTDRLFGFFILDAMLRSLGKVYIDHFSPELVGLFVNAYRSVHDISIRQGLLFLKEKWRSILPRFLMDRLEDELLKIEPNISQMLPNNQTQRMAQKRQLPIYDREDPNAKYQKLYGPQQCSKIQHPPTNVHPPNFNLPPPMVPFIPPINFPLNVPPPFEFRHPSITTKPPANEMSSDCYSNPQKEDTQPPTIKPENKEYFPNLSEPIELVKTASLDLNNYSPDIFSKFNKIEVDQLYEGTPCRLCGLRFKNIDGKEYQEHELVHEYKTNHPLMKRKYNKYFTDWIKKSEHSLMPKTNPSVIPQYPMFEDDNRNLCSGCYEKFDIKFDNDQDSFMLQNAEFVDGEVYHPTCAEDIWRG